MVGRSFQYSDASLSLSLSSLCFSLCFSLSPASFSLCLSFSLSLSLTHSLSLSSLCFSLCFSLYRLILSLYLSFSLSLSVIFSHSLTHSLSPLLLPLLNPHEHYNHALCITSHVLRPNPPFSIYSASLIIAYNHICHFGVSCVMVNAWYAVNNSMSFATFCLIIALDGKTYIQCMGYTDSLEICIYVVDVCINKGKHKCLHALLGISICLPKSALLTDILKHKSRRYLERMCNGRFLKTYGQVTGNKRPTGRLRWR